MQTEGWGIAGGETDTHSAFSLQERLLRSSSPPIFVSHLLQGLGKDVWLSLADSSGHTATAYHCF